MSARHSSRADERGQILVIVGAGMLVFLSMIALIIDGGHAWGQQRNTQNGADAAAEAGAVRLAENLPWKVSGQPLANSDAEVLAAVESIAAQNNIEVDTAIYTDFDGNSLGLVVGAQGTGDPPGTAEGVKVTASKEFDTFLAGVMGFNELTARTDATAIAGYIVDEPPSGVLPVTFPVTVPYCDGSNDLITSADAWVAEQSYILPLCSSGPGNVGWLDWTVGGHSPGCSGTGVAELACSIENPNNPELTIPGWYFVAQTGNVNSGQVQNALEDWIGRPATIPLFDATCTTQPPLASDLCTTGPGNGQNQYYHFKNWITFTIEEVYVSGGAPECNMPNGGTGCLVGTFHQMFGPGRIARAIGDESALAKVGVQLID
ncbi:MAG TPA: pilus assembly protein TadG-related protein [Candidatus Limnocylindrales bacterium]|nr:pilus assembly protein TadG-related protein [Candidatus Limnocylindrales bacterium]